MAPEMDAQRSEPSTDNGAGSDPQVVRLLAEELSVGKVLAETAHVRVRVSTREHQELVEVPLVSERWEIERVPVDREIEAIPPRRQEGDTLVVPVVEEVVVVRRKLVLKEEVRLRLVRSTEQHRETVTLRRQEAAIERLPVEQLSTEKKAD
jgi:uncharacterized protein (TIGR02271 family)